MEKFNASIPVKYGLISFTAVIILGLLMYVFYQSLVAHFVLFGFIQLCMLAFILFLGIWSGISYRREGAGVISFGHAFMAVYLVFVFYCVGTTCSMLLINKVVDRDYAEKLSSAMKEKMTDQFEKMNMDEDKIKEAMKNMVPEKFDPPASELFKSLTISLGISGVIAVLIALFIKRGSSDLVPTDLPPGPIRSI